MQIVDDAGVLLSCARKDHYRAVNKPDLHHTWIICEECHDLRHRGPLERFDPAFNNYQDKLRAFVGYQPDLFRRIA
jgi:hypothetical protein